MLSSLLRPFVGQRVEANRDDRPGPSSPGPANREYVQLRHATADFTEADDDDSTDDGRRGPPRARARARGNGDDNDEDGDEDEDEDEDGQPQPPRLLPLFSASHLGKCLLPAP